MAAAVMRPLTSSERMQPRWVNGKKTSEVVSRFIKPNDRLTSFERLEIYNRQYWFRILECFYEDFPGLREVLGSRQFEKMAQAYLAQNPSRSFTLRNLGDRLGAFLKKEPKWARPHEKLARDMVRFEWAQIEVFDGEAKPVLTAHHLQRCEPATLRLGLQPYLRFLKLEYPVDDFLIACKKQKRMREEVSNAVQPRGKDRKSTSLTLPKPEKIYMALHRFNETLYYKRLTKEGYSILKSLKKGESLQSACIKTGCVESAQIKEWFESWMSLGWFCQFEQSSTLLRIA